MQLPSADGRYIIVVGQEWGIPRGYGADHYHRSGDPVAGGTAADAASFLWLTRALTPLRLLARQLQRRNPAELTLLAPPVLPKEVSPMLGRPERDYFCVSAICASGKPLLPLMLMNCAAAGRTESTD